MLEAGTYPVLCISKTGFLNTVENRETLETCGQSALKTGYFSGLEIVDSQGIAWEVRSVTRVAHVEPLRGWRFFRSRQIRVRLELDRCHAYALDELQERVCTAIDQLPEQWEAVEDIEQTKARVRSSQSIPSLIALFAGQS